MAASGPAAAAGLAGPTAAAAGPPRPMPYAAAPLRQPHHALPRGHPFAPVAATARARIVRRRMSMTLPRCAMTHGSPVIASHRPLQPGMLSGRGCSVLARYFKDGSGLGGLDGDITPPRPTTPSSADEKISGAMNGGGIGPRPPSPQGNAVPFVASTRQRHHQNHAAAAAATAAAAGAAAASQREALAPGAAPRRRAGADSEENGAYAGADEEMRRRSHALREAMFTEAEQRAVSVHPDILVGDLALEATVPYDAAGGLDPLPARGDEGEAAGPPSGGAGPHAGLEVEDVDPETGGFTTSFPAVDPAYDDVGRAIRKEQGSRGGHRRHHPSPLVAEARARKAATAEDLRETLLDAAPELQDTYRAFGLPAGADLGRRMGGGDGGGGDGAVEATDEEVEAILEAGPFGTDGAVLAKEAEEPPEAVSALADPLAPTANAAAASGADSLDAALDALEHRKVMDLLESGAVGLVAATSIDDDDDISHVMPSPLLELPAANAAAAASSKISIDVNSGRATSQRNIEEMALSSSGSRAPQDGSGGRAAAGGGLARSGAAARRRSAPPPPPARRKVVIHGGGGGGGVRRAAQHAAPLPASSGYPAFYHTSPDVTEEDLLHRRQPARSLVPSASTAAAAARFVRGAVRHPRDGKQAAAEGPAGPGAGAANAGAASGVSGSRAGWFRQAPLYNTSPDVPDEELERTAGVAAAMSSPDGRAEWEPSGDAPASQTPPERPPAVKPRRTEGNASPIAPSAATPNAAALPPRSAPAPPSPRVEGDGRRLRSLSDVDRQFIDLDSVGGWDEEADHLRNTMRATVPKAGRSSQHRLATQPPGARGASSSLQPQTIGIHGSAGPSGAVGAACAGTDAGKGSATGSGGGGDGSATATRGDGRTVTVLRVPSQTYGVARTAAVLAADGQLTLLARPTGPSPERVRAALKLLRMAPDSRDFRSSAAQAAAAAAGNDERAAAAAEAATVAAAMAAVGAPALELEAQHRPQPPAPVVEEQDLQPGLMLGQSEIDPGEVMADPTFPLESPWTDHHDPHDPHASPPMAEGEGHMLGLQANMWQEDYDEVMGQICDGQRSGWSEDAVNGGFDSDVY